MDHSSPWSPNTKSNGDLSPTMGDGLDLVLSRNSVFSKLVETK